MASEHINALLFFCSLFFIIFAVKEILQALRAIVAVNKTHYMLCGCAGLVTISLVIISLYSGVHLFNEAATSVYLLIFSLTALLVCCLLLSNSVINGLVSSTNCVECGNSTSVIDPLTGMYNRYYIDSRLKSEVASYKRYTAPLSVLTVNILNFHYYNTEYGYQAGDRLLTTTASIIKHSVRATDIVARYEADRFVILLTKTPENSIDPVLNRLQKELIHHMTNEVEEKEVYARLNVKFGKAWCSLSTRSGTELVNAALERCQNEKTPVNKQDTLKLVYREGIVKQLDHVA